MGAEIRVCSFHELVFRRFRNENFLHPLIELCFSWCVRKNPLHASAVEERLQFLEQSLRLLLRYEVTSLGDNDVAGNVLREGLDKAPLCAPSAQAFEQRGSRLRDVRKRRHILDRRTFGLHNRLHRAPQKPVICRKGGNSSEHKPFVPNTRLWNWEFAKPLRKGATR